MNISFGTSCMNRVHHLESVYVNNIKTALEFDDTIRFVLLNYNSTDGMHEWVNDTLQEFLKLKIVKYIHTTKPDVFSQSITKNITMKNSTGDIVCNLDADNILTNSFMNQLLGFFTTNKNPIVRGHVGMSGCAGRVACLKRSLIELGGFNELMKGWGYEETDFIIRFEKYYNTKCLFFSNSVLASVDGPRKISDDERLSNAKNIALSNNMLEKKQYILTPGEWGVVE